MSQLDSKTTLLQDPATAKAQRGVLLEKKPSDVYTVMLGISLVALLFACFCMWSEWSTYKEIKDKPQPVGVTQ